MKKQLMSIAVATALSVNIANAAARGEPASAPAAHKRQAIGLGIGSAAGAVIAGPAGLVAGGIIGAIAGWSNGLEADLHSREKALDAARIELATLESRNSLMLSQATAAPVLDATPPDARLASLGEALSADFSLDIYFRSGSCDVEPYYRERLEAVAALLNAFADLEIELEGHADRRGSDAQNVRLSTERIHAVKAVLMSAGVDPHRMLGRPHGERKPVTRPGDAPVYAFDRRVQLRLSAQPPGETPPVASLNSTATDTH